MSENITDEKISTEEFYIRKISELLRQKPEMNFIRKIYTLAVLHVHKEREN